MKDLESQIAAIGEVVSLLRMESLAAIDFDALCGQLEALHDVLGQMVRVTTELGILRQDITQRISGMSRAAAVARGTHRDVETAEELDERLTEMSARELVRCYGRVAARFRDTFPASMSAVTGFGSRGVLSRCADESQMNMCQREQ